MDTDAIGISLSIQRLHYTVGLGVVTAMVDHKQIVDRPGYQDRLHEEVHVAPGENFIGTEQIEIEFRIAHGVRRLGAHGNERIFAVSRLRSRGGRQITLCVSRRDIDVVRSVAIARVVRDQAIHRNPVIRDQRFVRRFRCGALGLIVGAAGDQHLRGAGPGGSPDNIDGRLGNVLEVNIGDFACASGARNTRATQNQHCQATH